MTELQQQCEVLRSLHRPGDPLLLPNAWDAATARAVVAAGCNLEDSDHRTGGLRDTATGRAKAYLDVGVDCVYPIGPWDSDALRHFVSDVQGPVHVTHWPQSQSPAELAELAVARVSWAIFLYQDAMARFADELGTLQG